VAEVAWVSEKMFSREQYEQLRSFPEISRDELFRYFTLTPADVAFADPGAGRGPADRLGIAVQQSYRHPKSHGPGTPGRCPLW
jgi:hypothetical protein